MGLARRAPRPRSTALRLAIANIHRPGALTTERRAVARARPRAARHRDRDRRQSAPAVHGGAAREGAVVLLPRHPVGRGRALRRLHPRAGAARHARARADAARPHRGGERRSRPRSSSRRRAPPGCCRATAASPMRTRCRRARAWSKGEWWPPDYQGPPLVSFEKKIAERARPQARRSGHRQRARPQHHRAHRQPARARLAEPRHQFRDGVLALDLPRRAGDPHRHADLSGRRHHRRGDRAAQGGGGRLPVGHHGAGARGARRRRRPRDQPRARASAARARSR